MLNINRRDRLKVKKESLQSVKKPELYFEDIFQRLETQKRLRGQKKPSERFAKKDLRDS